MLNAAQSKANMESQKTRMILNQVNKKPLHLVNLLCFLEESIKEGIIYAIIALGEVHLLNALLRFIGSH